MRVREITETGMPQIQTVQVAQAVMPDGSIAPIDTDIGKKDTGTVFQDTEGNLGIAEPGKALEPGQTAADKNLLKDPNKLKMMMDKQIKDAAKKQADQAKNPNAQPQAIGTSGTSGTV
jgi:hypothetical protein